MNQIALKPRDRWKIVHSPGNSIRWDVRQDAALPQHDHIELSGRLVSVVLEYSVDSGRIASVTRKVYWPILRAKPDDVRGYLRYFYGDEYLPRIFDGEQVRKPLSLAPVRCIEFDGVMTIRHETDSNLQLTRMIFASVDQAAVIEQCTLTYDGDAPMTVSLLPPEQPEAVPHFIVGVGIDNVADVTLKTGESTTFGVIYFAVRDGSSAVKINVADEYAKRQAWLATIAESLQLHSPQPSPQRDVCPG